VLALVAATVAAATAPASGAAAALVVGISDQRSETLADARLAALPIAHARLVLPWDAALTEPARVNAWLAAAQARGLVPLVAFERGTAQTCPAACVEPTSGEYADAFRAFRARWPAVHEFTPWNEPNHPAQPTARHPATAAGYHDQLRLLCPDCTVVAGDLVDNASMKSYFRAYAAALRTPAQVWGIHSYGDVTYDRPPYTGWLIDQVATPVWMTETGGIVRLGAPGAETLPYDLARAAASIDRVFALADAHRDRIARVYLYQWQALPGDDFDAGLIAPEGTARPSLARLQAHLGVASGAPGAPDPDGPSAAPPAARPGTGARTESRTGAVSTAYADVRFVPVELGAGPPLRVGRPTRVHGGVRLRADCPRARRSGCSGSITVLLQVGVKHAPLRLGRASVRLRGGQSRRIRVAVTRELRRRWNRAAAWELRTVSVIRAPTGVQDRTWRTRAG
jgi:hypothetical protein